MPTWVAHFNKRVLNKREIRRGKRPVITHVGRKSGTVFHTPLDAHQVDGGYIFILMYGSGSDWVRNVLAAGTATLRIGESEIKLSAPNIITRDAAWQLLPATTKAPPDFLKVTEYLYMETVQ